MLIFEILIFDEKYEDCFENNMEESTFWKGLEKFINTFIIN